MKHAWGLKYAKRSILLFLILTLGISLFSPVMARAESYEKLKADGRAYSYMYYFAMKLCIEHSAVNFNPGMNDGIAAAVSQEGRATKPSNGNWFQSEMDVNILGKALSCNSVAQNAVTTYWGYSAFYLFLEDLGYTYQPNTGNGQWVNTQADSEKLKKFEEAMIEKKVATSITPADQYRLYLDTFKAVCTPKETLYSELNNSEKERVDQGKDPTGTDLSGRGTYLKVVENGLTVKYGVEYKSRLNTVSNATDNVVNTPVQSPKVESIYGYNATKGRTVRGEEANCAGMLDKIRATATAYSNALRQDACAALGYRSSTNPAGSAACMAGYLHQNDANYCVNHYPDVNSTERKGCDAGLTGGAIDPGDNTSANETQLGSAPACTIDGIGWIVCPVINFLAWVADGAFVVLADNFLRTDPQVFNTDTSTFAAWSTMRTIANVAFVIVFLIIIFSQLTGAGITNYGVKKMLPRLVVAAILVNTSYFISQLAIDVSNILGYSLRDVLGTLTNTVSPATAQEAIDAGSNPIASGEGFVGIAGGILALAAVGLGFYALLSTFVPILLAAVVALIMIMFILVARQAIIILLVVVSPLAFVAFLLPNTQNLFTQWRKIFTSMLLLFPIIALVFGLSTLASQILTDTFSNSINGDTDNWFGQIVASAVLILPLFVVPMLLKKSLDSIPMLGQLASKLSSRANGNIGKKAREAYGSSIMGQRQMNRKRGSEEFRNQRTAKRIQDGGLAGALAGGIAITKEQKAQRDAVRNAARATVAGAESKELSHAQEALKGEIAGVVASGGDKDAYLEALAVDSSRTEADRSAAMHMLAVQGRDASVRRLMNNPAVNQESLRRAIEANSGSLLGKAPDIVKGRAAAFKEIRGEELAGFTDDTAQEYLQHLGTLSGTDLDTAMDGFNAAMQDIAGSPELQGRFGGATGKVLTGATPARAGSAPIPAAVQARITAAVTPRIGADGKIR